MIHHWIFIGVNRDSKAWHWNEKKLKKIGLHEHRILTSDTFVIIQNYMYDRLEELKELEIDYRLQIHEDGDCVDFYMNGHKLKKVIKHSWISEERVEELKLMFDIAKIK